MTQQKLEVGNDNIDSVVIAFGTGYNHTRTDRDRPAQG